MKREGEDDRFVIRDGVRYILKSCRGGCGVGYVKDHDRKCKTCGCGLERVPKDAIRESESNSQSRGVCGLRD